MNKIFSPQGSKRRRGGKRRNKGTGLLKSQPNQVLRVNPGRFLAPPIPKELSVALTDRFVIAQQTASTVLSTTYFGLLEFLGRSPLYSRELFAIYRYARVTAVSYHFEIVNTTPVMLGSGAIEAAFAVMPFADTGTASLTQICEKPGVVRKIISPSGGMDRQVLQKLHVAQDWMGNPFYTKDYWMDVTQSTSATPLDTQEPVVLLGIQSLGTGAAIGTTFLVSAKLVYHIQYFDLKLPPASS